MSRGLLFGRAEWPGVGSLVLSSTHLESFVGAEHQAVVLANRRSQARGAAATPPRGCNPVQRRLQPCASEAATLCASEAATLCTRG